MTLTQQSFKTIFYIVLGLCILTIILSATSFDFVEVDTAISWTMKYFAFPILLIMIPTCYFIYLKFIIQHETKKYKSKVWTNLRTTFRIFILTIAMTAIFIGTTLSLIILTNAYLGDSKQINLNAKIVDYYTTRNKGRTKFHIKIQDVQIDRIVELQVDKPYIIGEQFSKTMNIGEWGLLYSRE